MQTDDKPHPHKVNLIVHEDGRFQYTGGKDNNGHLHAKEADGTVVFRIDVPGNRWVIHDVEIGGDPRNQLGTPRIQGSRAEIDDVNTEEMQASYCVSVRNAQGVVIRCDPMISNEPRGMH